MVNPYLLKLTFLLVLIKTINIKCQIKSIMYAALESYAYDNILVIKYFCITMNFTRIYVCTHSDLSNDQSYYIHINLNVRITIAQFNYK